MTSNEVNSVIDNICNKLGTTLDVLIPEMAGYSIARWSIGLVLGSVFIIATIYCLIKILKMRNDEGHRYIDTKRLKETLEKHGGSINESQLYWITDKVHYYEDDYMPYIIIGIMLFFIGLPIICIAIENIIGWSIAPHAMMFRYVVNCIGG